MDSQSILVSILVSNPYIPLAAFLFSPLSPRHYPIQFSPSSLSFLLFSLDSGMESFINNFLPLLLRHFYRGTVWTPCQFPESILHSQTPQPPLNTHSFFFSHSSLPLSVETMSMSRQLYPVSAAHTNFLCLPPKGWWQQSNFLLMWMLHLPLSHSQSLMAPPALQTSDLISDISAVIATGIFLNPATSSASAGYFCWKVAEPWQAQQQEHKPKDTSSTLWASVPSDYL